MKIKLTADSLKLLQDWGKWLIALETFVCASLWPKLTVAPKPPAPLYLGWVMFWASIIAASVLLLYIPVVVGRLDADKSSGGGSDLNRVTLLVALEYAFFLAGLFCFAWRLVQFWLGA